MTLNYLQRCQPWSSIKRKQCYFTQLASSPHLGLPGGGIWQELAGRLAEAPGTFPSACCPQCRISACCSNMYRACCKCPWPGPQQGRIVSHSSPKQTKRDQDVLWVARKHNAVTKVQRTVNKRCKERDWLTQGYLGHRPEWAQA